MCKYTIFVPRLLQFILKMVVEAIRMGDKSRISSVGFEVLQPVVMKSNIVWDITLCSPLSVNRRFGGTFRLHLQGRKNKHTKKPA
jgi:hypothetical protein